LNLCFSRLANRGFLVPDVLIFTRAKRAVRKNEQSETSKIQRSGWVYLPVLCFPFFAAAKRSAFFRRAARFLILSLA